MFQRESFVKITEISENKKKYLPLLLLGDEDEKMIDRYLDKARMFVLEDPHAIGVCAVTDEGDGVLEIKNLAVNEAHQKKGYGRALINFVKDFFQNDFEKITVGTGDSPLTIPFYEKCGFKRCGIKKNFFVDNYDHPIIEAGIQLVDMIYLEINLT